MEQVPASLPLVGGKETPVQHPTHPLGPLTAAEISESSSLIKAMWPAITNIQFKTITLYEPSKAELTPYLAAEHAGKPTPSIDRKSFVVYYIRNTVSSGIDEPGDAGLAANHRDFG
jgi:primary-amine oxidase